MAHRQKNGKTKRESVREEVEMGMGMGRNGGPVGIGGWCAAGAALRWDQTGKLPAWAVFRRWRAFRRASFHLSPLLCTSLYANTFISLGHTGTASWVGMKDWDMGATGEVIRKGVPSLWTGLFTNVSILSSLFMMGGIARRLYHNHISSMNTHSLQSAFFALGTIYCLLFTGPVTLGLPRGIFTM